MPSLRHAVLDLTVALIVALLGILSDFYLGPPTNQAQFSHPLIFFSETCRLMQRAGAGAGGWIGPVRLNRRRNNTK